MQPDGTAPKPKSPVAMRDEIAQLTHEAECAVLRAIVRASDQPGVMDSPNLGLLAQALSALRNSPHP